MGVEGIPDAAGVGGAIGEVAIVIVGRQIQVVPVVGAAAIDQRTGVALAARLDPIGGFVLRQDGVPEIIHFLPAGIAAERVSQFLRQVPVGRAGDIAFAVPFVTHRALVRIPLVEVGARHAVVAIRPRAGGDVGWRDHKTTRPVQREFADIAHAGAACGTIDDKTVADTTVVGLQEGEGIAGGLTGAHVVGTTTNLCLDAVAELVHEHARELTGIGALRRTSRPGLEEVQRAAIPVGIADVVDVDVGLDRAIEPAVARVIRGCLAVDIGEVIERVARRMRAAAVGWLGAIGAVAGSQMQVTGAGCTQRRIAAVVGNLDVLAVERG